MSEAGSWLQYLPPVPVFAATGNKSAFAGEQLHRLSKSYTSGGRLGLARWLRKGYASGGRLGDSWQLTLNVFG